MYKHTHTGHQKKLMLAVKKLAELQKAADGGRGSPRKKHPPAQEVMSIESPPYEGGECMSPKMSTFQDSELSGELQAALTRPPAEREPKPGPPDARPNSGGAHPHPPPGQRARSLQENSLGKEEPSHPGPPRKEARTMRQSSQPAGQRGSVSSSAQGKQPRQSYPQGAGPPYTPPQTPTKTKGSGQQATGSPAKSKPGAHLLSQADRPMSPRSHTQSPTHRASAGHQPPPAHAGPPPPAVAVTAAPEPAELPPQAAPQPGPNVSVPLLCLPPDGDGEPAEQDEQGTIKKRAHSLNRYAASDSEQERDELGVPGGGGGTGGGGKYATVQNRVGRSNSMRGQADKNVNRSQSFALRPKKKGPPPPPPKRSSSAISSSSSNLTEVPAEPSSSGPLLDVNYHPQRRASDLGGTVDTGSAGSVRSIAAMLEMSSIGGGAKGLAMQKAPPHYLQVNQWV